MHQKRVKARLILAVPSPCADGMYQLADDNEQGLDLIETEELITGANIARARDLRKQGQMRIRTAA